LARVADKAAVRLGDPSLVFASIHHMLSLTGAGRYRAAETLLRSLRLQAQLLRAFAAARILCGKIGISPA
jgi:hypothetical protein